jgi:hypothetical protein
MQVRSRERAPATPGHESRWRGASLRSPQPAFRHPVRIEPARVLLRINVADVRRSLDGPAPLSRGVRGNDLAGTVEVVRCGTAVGLGLVDEVAGREIVGLRLTAAAYAHGLALALPEKVEMARPTGVERADAINIRIPIEGADSDLMAEFA